jgi:hypothetical protein
MHSLLIGEMMRYLALSISSLLQQLPRSAVSTTLEAHGTLECLKIYTGS